MPRVPATGPRPGGVGVSTRPGPGVATVVIGVVVAVADVSAVNSVLPELRRELGAGASDLQWVVSGYVLTYGLAMIVTGRIGDARGRRPTFLAGIAVFNAASVLAALAPSPGVLVVARLLQGFGAGFLNPQATALIREIVPPPGRPRVFALYTGCVGAALAVGPFLGGLLGSESWRWVFGVNVPVGLLVALGAFRFLPRTPPAGAAARPDVPGVLLLWAGLALLLVPVLELSDLPGPLVVAGLAAAVVVLALFVVRERRTAARGGVPVVDLSLFRQRSYTCGVTLNLTFQAGLTAVIYVLTLYLRSGLGLDQLAAGAMQLPVALGSLAVAPSAARLARRPRLGELAGVVLLVVGSAVTWAAIEVLHDSTTAILWAVVVPLVIVGVGGTLVMSLNLGVTNAKIPAEEAGAANAVRQTTARIGSALGTATVGALVLSALGPVGIGTTARAEWDRAMTAGMALSVAFLAVTLVPVLVDLVATRREQRAARSGPTAATP